MTEEEAKVVLGEHMCDKCYSKECDIKCDYAKAHDVAIKALDQVAKLRELRKNLAEQLKVGGKNVQKNKIPKGIVDKIKQRNKLNKEIEKWCNENLDMEGMCSLYADMNATNCTHYETVEGSNAYFLGVRSAEDDAYSRGCLSGIELGKKEVLCGITSEDAKSMICTLDMLKRLAFNIHGVIDVIDDRNIEKMRKILSQLN